MISHDAGSRRVPRSSIGPRTAALGGARGARVLTNGLTAEHPGDARFARVARAGGGRGVVTDRNETLWLTCLAARHLMRRVP